MKSSCIFRQFDVNKHFVRRRGVKAGGLASHWVWQSGEGGICHTWELASSSIHPNWPIYPNIFFINLKWPIPSGRVTEWFGWTMRVASAIHGRLIHSNWPIYPNIPTDWTGVCFQKQFWESEFEGLMSADHMTSLPCQQVSSTTPNFEIGLIICDHSLIIICDHIIATTLPPHVKWRCLRSKLLSQEDRSQTQQWVSAQFSNNWKPWLLCFYATEYQRNTGPHCHLKFEGFHELQRIILILFSGQSSDQLGLAASLNPYLSSSYHCIQCGRVEINILFVLWY